MANFNYVAPLVGKSYSEWNRERLTAKQAAEAANLKNQLASQQSQKDMHSKRLKELRGFKPENWSALDVEAFNSEVDYVRNNLAYFDETQWDNALNGLNQLLIFGDQQSELNSYDLQYQEGLQADERFQALLQNYSKNLQMSVQQEQNKMIGRMGVQPVNQQ